MIKILEANLTQEEPRDSVHRLSGIAGFGDQTCPFSGYLDMDVVRRHPLHLSDFFRTLEMTLQKRFGTEERLDGGNLPFEETK